MILVLGTSKLQREPCLANFLTTERAHDVELPKGEPSLPPRTSDVPINPMKKTLIRIVAVGLALALLSWQPVLVLLLVALNLIWFVVLDSKRNRAWIEMNKGLWLGAEKKLTTLIPDANTGKPDSKGEADLETDRSSPQRVPAARKRRGNQDG